MEVKKFIIWRSIIRFMAKYRYCRVSTLDQDLESQINSLKINIKRIKISIERSLLKKRV